MAKRRARRWSSSLQRRRLVVVAGIGLLGYGGLVARAIQLHALDADWLAARAAAQREHTLTLAPLRGEIRDRNDQSLALSANTQSVAASPRRIDRREAVASALAAALGTPAREIGRRLVPNRSFVWIRRWVTPDQAERVRRADIEGVSLLTERKRFYPSRDLAAAYLGFAGRDGIGLSGIELAFDHALRGRPMAIPVERDAHGQTLLHWDADRDHLRGTRLVLALDSQIQHVAATALDRALARTGARHASLIALEPYTGDVLALAERPAFDPNRFWEADPGSFRTRAFVDAFEPGSTLKPFVIAVALEEGAVDPDDRFDCENGSWRVLDRTIRDYRPHGVLSVHDIIRVSSNIGAAKVADQLGSTALIEGLQRLGFGRRTASGYPGEASGVVHPIREAQAVERANVAFGQGISVTAAQLAAAGAMLANGGYRVRPRLAQRLEGGLEASALELELPGGAGERVLSQRTSRRVVAMMRDAVARGTGRAAALERWAVAGKTGTAQKVVDGHYTEDHYVASFLGIVPANEPRLVIAVVLDEPRGVHTGGSVAAPVFREVASFAMEQLDVPRGGAE